ncbi:MAG: FAD binding domain-containing protein [Acidimicrobiales bacterium]
MKPAPFRYHRPATVAEATGLLDELGEGAKVLAGGQSLVPLLALRLTAFDDLVDIGRIVELQGIEARDGGLWVGAGTRTADVEKSAVAATVPLLTRATPLVGHFQIRNRGTVGGSVAHADPAAEYPAVARTLDATMEVASPSGRRTVAAAEFFEGLWTTTMAPDEVLTGITFPVWPGRTGFAVEELARRHGDFALAGAMVALSLDGNDRVQRCAVGLFGLGSVPERAAGAEAAAAGRAAGDVDPAELGRLATAGLQGVPDDLHGSATYRTEVGAVMVARAWVAAAGEARRSAGGEGRRR